MIRKRKYFVQVQVRTNEPSNQASVSRTRGGAYGPYEIYPDSYWEFQTGKKWSPNDIVYLRVHHSKVNILSKVESTK